MAAYSARAEVWGSFARRANVAGGVNHNRVVYSAGFSFFNVTRGIDDEDEARNTSGQGRILFRLTPTATISGRIYATNSRLQLNNNPEAIGTLPAPGSSKQFPSRVLNNFALKPVCPRHN